MRDTRQEDALTNGTGNHSSRDVPPNFASDMSDTSPMPSILKGNEAESQEGSKQSSTAKPLSWHRRNVSWGNNEVYSQINKEEEPKPPIHRNRGMSDTSELSNESFSFRRLYRSGSSRDGDGGRVINIDTVKKMTPRENEAETYLLRALEEQESNAQNNAPSAGVFANISDEVVQNIAVAVKTVQQHENTTVLNNSYNYDPKEKVTNESEISPDAVENSSIETHSHTPGAAQTATSPDPSSRRSQWTHHTKQNSVRHNRTMTMEEQLFGLTSTIAAFQDDAYEDIGQDMPMPVVQEEHIYGSADAFQHNATLIYRRVHENTNNTQSTEEEREQAHENASFEGNTSTAASTRLRAQSVSSMNHKKHDDYIIEQTELGQNHDQSSDDYEVVIDNNKRQAGRRIKSPTTNVVTPPERTRRSPYNKVFRDLQDFITPRQHNIFLFLRVTLLYVVAPLIFLACILFYTANNPPTGRLINNGKPINGTFVNKDGKVIDPSTASVSWWLLFFSRQVIVGVIAKGIEWIFIDFLALSSSTVQVCGPWLTLFFLQSKGWPFLLCFWGLLDLILLSRLTDPFSSHWLKSADAFSVFSPSNPSGNVVNSDWNHRVLSIALSLGLIVSLKRFWLGLHLGRQTFNLFSDRLASVMNKIILISEVASLGRKFERQHTAMHRSSATSYKRQHSDLPPALTVDGTKIENLLNAIPDESSVGGTTFGRSDTAPSGGYVVDPSDRHPLTEKLSERQKARIKQYLGAWEEPRKAERLGFERASVNALLQFRRALACLDTPFPFSSAFGLADTRENCIVSAQDVYYRLMLRNAEEEDALSFEIIALLGVMHDGSLNHSKLQKLIKLFRPDRDGRLDALAFVKGVDMVYKEIRLLRASVKNASKLDCAVESIFNVIFYALILTIVLSRLGFDPLALFLSISGVILAFAFMISSASSKYFEGLLFILVRRPYQIGDAIHVSSVDTDTNFGGSAWWIVSDMNLFSTKAVFLYTMEQASLSNGSLANSRIINSSQSPQAYLWFMLKFPVDVSYEKLQIFHHAVEEFVRNRPREWLSYLDFRATRVEVDKGYVDYLVGAQHRSSWSDWTTIMLSKADMVLFCMELQKKLGVFFRPPPLPVDLSVVSNPTAANAPSLETIPEASPGFTMNMDTATADSISNLQALFPPRTGISD